MAPLRVVLLLFATASAAAAARLWSSALSDATPVLLPPSPTRATVEPYHHPIGGLVAVPTIVDATPIVPAARPAPRPKPRRIVLRRLPTHLSVRHLTPQVPQPVVVHTVPTVKPVAKPTTVKRTKPKPKPKATPTPPKRQPAPTPAPQPQPAPQPTPAPQPAPAPVPAGPTTVSQPPAVVTPPAATPPAATPPTTPPVATPPAVAPPPEAAPETRPGHGYGDTNHTHTGPPGQGNGHP